MKILDKLLIDGQCFYSLLTSIFLLSLYFYTIFTHDITIFTHLVVVIMSTLLLIYSIYKYKETSYLLNHGVKVDADVKIYRKSYFSHNYVKLSFTYKESKFETNLSLTDNFINENMTAHIILNPSKITSYRVLLATKEIKTFR